MEPARGHRNPEVMDAVRLHRAKDRRSLGRALLEGPHLLEEALGAGFVPERIFALPGDVRTHDLRGERGLDVVVVDERAMAKLSGTTTPRGPVAVLSIPPGSARAGRHLVVSWGISDPGNVGTLVRTAAAFDWDFGFSSGTADPWSPKVLRAGAGAHFRIPLVPVASLDVLAKEGYTTVATVVDGGVAPETLPSSRHAVLVGDESHGLPGDVVGACDHLVTIPMPGGTESLNAAIAASIIVYELSRNAAGSASPPGNDLDQV